MRTFEGVVTLKLDVKVTIPDSEVCNVERYMILAYLDIIEEKNKYLFDFEVDNVEEVTDDDKRALL